MGVSSSAGGGDDNDDDDDDDDDAGTVKTASSRKSTPVPRFTIIGVPPQSRVTFPDWWTRRVPIRPPWEGRW